MFYIRKVGPNEALIVSGGGARPRVVVGSSTWISPFVQRADVLSLEIMTLAVRTPNVYTQEGVALSVDGVAQVKVARDEDSVRTAAQQFLGKSASEISQIALQTLEGHQRAMMATMTVEQIYQDRDSFAKQVREVASVDMARMGMEIVSFTIRDISDEKGYLDALGIRRTSQVKRDAAIGQAIAEKESSVEGAEARRQSEAARLRSEQQVAESQRDFELAQASYQKEINAAKAAAAAALDLEQARQRQKIREEELRVSLIERQKQIEIQEQETQVKQRELEANVRKPAEAERYRLETESQGRKAQVIAEAEARAQATRLQGEAEAAAESTQIRLRGEAEADAIRARGLAEAEAMRLKAEAWKEYGQAALAEQLLRSLPELARAIAEPLAKTEKIVVISGGGGGAGTGATRVTEDVTQAMARLPEAVKAMTGIDIVATLKNLPGVVSEPSKPSES
ncbi:MAG: flotillin family protein [Acidobacteria bacterium]|nr:flotillin family protein [Acidobacteriota bacterium]